MLCSLKFFPRNCRSLNFFFFSISRSLASLSISISCCCSSSSCSCIVILLERERCYMVKCWETNERRKTLPLMCSYASYLISFCLNNPHDHHDHNIPIQERFTRMGEPKSFFLFKFSLNFHTTIIIFVFFVSITHFWLVLV